MGLSRISQKSKKRNSYEGNFHYLAQELLEDANRHELPDLTKSDIFSLGCTLYELMISKFFFYNISNNKSFFYCTIYSYFIFLLYKFMKINILIYIFKIIGQPLPSNGMEWLKIRNNNLELLDKTNYSTTLINIIKSMMHKDPNLRPSANDLVNCNFLQSEIELKLKWEKTLNKIYESKIQEYENLFQNLKRKLSI